MIAQFGEGDDSGCGMDGPDCFKFTKEIVIDGVTVVIEAEDNVTLSDAHEAVAGRDGTEGGLVLDEFEAWEAAAEHFDRGIGAGIAADEDLAGWRVQGYQFFAGVSEVFAAVASSDDDGEGHCLGVNSLSAARRRRL